LDIRVDALFDEDAVPDHKGQHGPQTAWVIRDAVTVFLEHFKNGRAVEDVISLRLVNRILCPTEEFVTSEPVTHWNWEAQLLAVENMWGNDLLESLTQCVLGGAVRNLVFVRDGLRYLEYFLIQKWHAQFQRVGHIHLVSLDQDVAAHPGEQVQVLHASDWIHVLRLCVDGRGDLFMVPLWTCPRNHALKLLIVKGASITVVALFHGHGATLQQGLTLHAVRQDS